MGKGPEVGRFEKERQPVWLKYRSPEGKGCKIRAFPYCTKPLKPCRPLNDFGLYPMNNEKPK